MSETRTFIGTFGMGHPNANCYVEVEARDRVHAHERMFARYGPRWAFIYDSPDDAGVDEWDLTRLEFGDERG